MRNSILVSVAALVTAGTVCSADNIALPAPTREGGMPLMQALNERRTMRNINPDKPLPPGMLSDLLWAAWGVNRDDGRRTAPTARNKQEITLYVMLASGTYRYDAQANELVQVSAGRVNADAPVELIFVVDSDLQPKPLLASVDCGFVGQNIYLYCASAGLATVFKATFNRPAYEKILVLPPKDKILYVQPVGFPLK